MKIQLVVVVAILTLLTANPVSAQAPPQDGHFKKVCDLYGAADSGSQAWNKNEKCDLTKEFRLDASYHQQNFACCGGGATSDIATSDIPAGIHLQVDGGHYWSVDQPIALSTLEEDPEGRAIHRRFLIHTYCGPEGWPGPGCNVKVTVWAKER